MAQAVFGRAVGTLGDSFHFRDEISSSNGSGVANVAELNDLLSSMSHTGDNSGTHGLLAILEEARTFEALPGQHPEDHFNIVPHHAPGALVTHVPLDLLV